MKGVRCVTVSVTFLVMYLVLSNFSPAFGGGGRLEACAGVGAVGTAPGVGGGGPWLGYVLVAVGATGRGS
jgi:hypothetical protein